MEVVERVWMGDVVVSVWLVSTCVAMLSGGGVNVISERCVATACFTRRKF